MKTLSTNELPSISGGMSWGCQLAWAGLGLAYLGLFCTGGSVVVAGLSVLGLNLAPFGILAGCRNE